MPTIKLCTRRKVANQINLEKDESTLKIRKGEGGEGQIHKYYSKTAGRECEFFCFDVLKENEYRVAVWMNLPHYFEELVSPANDPTNPDVEKGFGLHGVFLFNDIKLKPGMHCLHVGPNGCPPWLSTGDFRGFTFNSNRFYPFVMTDNTVAFFSCDLHSEDDRKWQKNFDENGKLGGISIIEPIVYNATLGIYMTRQADLKKVSEFLA